MAKQAIYFTSSEKMATWNDPAGYRIKFSYGTFSVTFRRSRHKTDALYGFITKRFRGRLHQRYLGPIGLVDANVLHEKGQELSNAIFATRWG